jgi:polyisoprenoid-binding protein YceI
LKIGDGKSTEIRICIDESAAHAEFGIDVETKNRNATGSLSRHCQKHSEDTTSRSTAQLQATVNLSNIK